MRSTRLQKSTYRTPSAVCLALAVVLSVVTVPNTVRAVPYRLTQADRAEITALMQRFFTAVSNGQREPVRVFPTRAELLGLYVSPRAQPGEGEALAQRQLAAIERDVRSLREPFAHGRFVGLRGREITTGTLEIRPCGRLALTTSRCATGPVLQWSVGDEAHSVRIDTLVRLPSGWRVYDVRR